MSQEITFEKRGAGGWVFLQRHEALNALSLSMLEKIHEALDHFAQDDSVRFVVVDSLNPKAFCAGGDIRAAYDHRHDLTYARRYFDLEYGLNERIAAYKKPYISLIDGLCLGGGMGLACHGTHRLMSDRAQMAMPETAIGFFPDVGAGYYLNRCPKHMGRYLGLTGARLHVADALWMKLATHGLCHSEFENLRAFLEALHGPHGTHELQLWLAAHPLPPAEGPLTRQAGLLDTCFRQETVEEILTNLHLHKNVPLIQETLDLLALRSPLSLKITLAYLKKCEGLMVSEVLALDKIVALNQCKGLEFYEGVRAMVVDKDKSPAWSPSTLEAVSEAQVLEYFIPPGID